MQRRILLVAVLLIGQIPLRADGCPLGAFSLPTLRELAGQSKFIVVARPVGAEDRMLNLQWFRGTLTYATSGATRGHSAAANAFSVAATPALQPLYGPIPTGPYPNAFSSGAKVEIFSSDGPRRVFFDVNGNLLAGAVAGNFKSTGGVVRQKPDVTAADGVKTDTPGFSTFYGTSAAAPHAAAIAALVRQANPGATSAQL